MDISEAARAMGKLGNQAKMKKISPERRREIALNAIRTRWAKTPKSERSKTRARRGKEGAA